MRGSRPGTLHSSGRWEIQFQDILIEIVHTKAVSSQVFYSAFLSILNSISTPAGFFFTDYFSVISLSANSDPIST